MNIEEIITERKNNFKPPTLREAMQWFPDTMLVHPLEPLAETPRGLAEQYPKSWGYHVDKKKECNKNIRSINDHLDSMRPQYQKVSLREQWDVIVWFHEMLIKREQAQADWCDSVLFHLKLMRNPKQNQQFNLDIQKAKAVPITNFIQFRSNIAPCIWHNEKTPSMHYYPKDNHVHCFGCNKGGDTIDVVQAMYDKDFKEAVTFLNQ